MKNKKYILLTLLVSFCNSVFAVEKIACGNEWINVHKGNPELTGIYINQYPENKSDKKHYIGKHPATVIYLFSDYMMHQITYSPTGQVQNGNWWSAEDSLWLYEKAKKKFKNNVSCHFSIK